MTSEKKHTTASCYSSLRLFVSLTDWVQRSRSCRGTSRNEGVLRLTPATDLDSPWAGELHWSWWVLVCHAGMPSYLQHMEYCVLRETGFQNTEPLHRSPCHPVWNIKSRLREDATNAESIQYERLLFFFLLDHAAYWFRFSHILWQMQAVSVSISVFAVAYASCNYAMKAGSLPGEI